MKSFYFCFTLKPWSKNISRSLIKEPKYYLWDVCSYIPIGSTVTGFGQALLALIHTIKHLAKTIFNSKNRFKHLEEAKIGAKCIARGILSMVPFIGNVIVVVADQKKFAKSKKLVEERLKEKQQPGVFYACMFYKDKLIKERYYLTAKAATSNFPTEAAKFSAWAPYKV